MAVYTKNGNNVKDVYKCHILSSSLHDFSGKDHILQIKTELQYLTIDTRINSLETFNKPIILCYCHEIFCVT